MMAMILISFALSLFDDSPLASLLAERTAKRAAMVVAYREAKDDDRDRIYREWQIQDKAMAAKIFEAALAHAERPEAFEILVTMVVQPHAEARAAAEAIRKHHLTRTYAGETGHLRKLASVQAGVALVGEIEAKNPSSETQAAAAFALGEAAKRRSDDQSTDRQAEKAKAKAAFERAIAKATQSGERSRELGKQARGHLAGLANSDRLLVGAEAPELSGIDTDGHKLNLSQFRGRVVLVDFWAFWCDSCVQLIPHQRELIRRFQGKPFTVLGVNGDLDYGSDFQRSMEKFKVSWRSLKNDPGGDGAKLSDAWNVDGWPTLYLIDPQGIIRKKWAGGPKDPQELDREIGKLMPESRN
jgi:peroxiredoxin